MDKSEFIANGVGHIMTGIFLILMQRKYSGQKKKLKESRQNLVKIFYLYNVKIEGGGGGL